MIKLSNLLKYAYVAGILVVIFVAPKAHAATWDPGKIIDDGVFTNKDSMTVQEIQTFLNSKVPTCDTQHAPDVRYSGGANPPWTCLKDYYENPSTAANNLNGNPIPAGAISAAQIIWNYAQQYSINPRVLIVTLQKENGLITDTWPYPWQYRTAMGFACPDTAACDPAYYGFAKQVYQAARHFRNFYDENPNWTVPYKVGTRYILYNPDTSCGGSNVNIVTHGTAALYSYTPYQPNAGALAAGYGTATCGAYGNRNFWLFYNDWFGSTLFPQPLGGSLFSQISTGKIFLATEGARYFIPNWSTMTNYGLDTYAAQPVSDATIQQYADGGTLTNLIWDSGGVYLVNNGARYHVPSAMCGAWGFSCSDGTAVKPLGAQFQTQYLRGGWELAELAAANGVTYKMSSGQRLPIANSKTQSDLGLAATSVLLTSNANSNQPLGPLLLTTPSKVYFPPITTAYYFDGTNYYTDGDADSNNDWTLSTDPSLTAPTSSYNASGGPASTALSAWYQDGSGQNYIIDQGRKLSIPASLQSVWTGTAFSNTAPQALVSRLQLTALQPNIWADPNIYVLFGGKKHYVRSYDDFIALGINDSNTTSLRPGKVSNVTQGADALPEGKVLGLQDGNLYVVNARNLLHIASPDVFSVYGFNWNNIPAYPASITTDYPISPGDLTYGVTPDYRYLLPSGAHMLQLSQTAAADFGLNTTTFSSIASAVAKSATPTTMSRFLYNADNGKIYYASGGAIHYISTYEAFVGYGGTRIPATSVNTAIINLFLLGQPI